jgi:hypothetical protein
MQQSYSTTHTSIVYSLSTCEMRLALLLPGAIQQAEKSSGLPRAASATLAHTLTHTTHNNTTDSQRHTDT